MKALHTRDDCPYVNNAKSSEKLLTVKFDLHNSHCNGAIGAV